MSDEMDASKPLVEWETDRLAWLWICASLNPELQLRVGVILKQRIATENKFFREYVFVANQMVMTVWFVPTSSAFERYGQYATGNLILDDFERAVLARNLVEKTWTYGTLRFNGIDPHLTPAQVGELAQTGFVTNEIMRIDN